MRLSLHISLTLLNSVLVGAFVSQQGRSITSFAIGPSTTRKDIVFSKPAIGFVPPKSRQNVYLGSTAAADLPSEDEKVTQNPGGSASMTASIVNLIKSIVGAGVLSLPAGIAAFGNAPSALIPACFLIAFIGGLSGYGFSLIGRVCHYTGSTSYREGERHNTLVPLFALVLLMSPSIFVYSMGKVHWPRNKYCPCCVLHLQNNLCDAGLFDDSS